MKIYNDWNEAIYKNIARKTGVQQTVKDVSYARFAFYHSPQKRYAERIDEDAFILGVVNKNNFRIIGMGTNKEMQGKGYATTLLNRAKYYCYKNGIKKMITRTLVGKDFYIKVANAKVIAKKNDDYVMEINV